MAPSAAAYQEEVPDVPGLHRFNNLVRNTENSVPAEAHQDGLLRFGLLESRGFQGGVYHRLEVVSLDVLDSRPGNQAGGEYPGPVVFLRLLYAVGGHQNGPGNFSNSSLLVLPGATVVACKMGKLLKAGVSVTGKHLPVV